MSHLPDTKNRLVMSPSSGFTLVEMMVVISILTLLISMTLPALGRSRENARRVIDASNLREFAVACMNYAGDHNEELPYAWRYNHNQDHFRWFRMSTYQMLTKYGVTTEIATCNNVNYLSSGQPTGDPAVPADLRKYDTHIGWIYWGNRQDLIPFDGSKGYKTYRKLSSRPSPSSKTLVTCAAEDTKTMFWSAIAPHVRGSSTAFYLPPFSTYTPVPEGLNVGYVDGAASWVAFEELTAIREAHTPSPYGTIFYHDR